MIPLIWLIWLIWLLVPILVDCTETIGRTLLVSLRPMFSLRRARSELPAVTVIVPVYNEADTIVRCLESLRKQDYPGWRLEVIVVDDGSTDATSEAVREYIERSTWLKGELSSMDPMLELAYRARKLHTLRKTMRCLPRALASLMLSRYKGELADMEARLTAGCIRYVRIRHSGKPKAITRGLMLANGEIIVTVDADVELDRAAIRRLVEAILDKRLDAASGSVLIDLRASGAAFKEKLLAKLQYIEYISAFLLGRAYQDLLGVIFCLAGAFSGFRREILLRTLSIGDAKLGLLFKLHDIGEVRFTSRTVVEDLDVTLMLHERGFRTGFVEDAIAYLTPARTVSSLYSQRVRWRRGQLEALALFMGKQLSFRASLLLSHIMMVDFTIGVLRLIWAPLLLTLPLMGLYPMLSIIAVLLLTYVLYVLVDLLQLAATYFKLERRRDRLDILSCIPYVLVMPLYRALVFYFRMSAYLQTLKTEPKWRTQLLAVAPDRLKAASLAELVRKVLRG